MIPGSPIVLTLLGAAAIGVGAGLLTLFLLTDLKTMTFGQTVAAVIFCLLIPAVLFVSGLMCCCLALSK